MSTLEEIKEREAAPRGVLGWSNPYSDEYLSALEASHADVLKLIAALEAVRTLHVPILEHGDPVGCRTCDWEADGDYPCATLTSITEALA